MRNPESVQENKTHEIFWDFMIQTDYLISVRRPHLVIVTKKKKSQPADYRSSWPQGKTERKQKER